MRFGKMGLACAATLVLASAGISVFAQAAPGGAAGGARQGRGGGQGRGMGLTQIPVGVLAHELKLTDDQKTKITDIQTKFAEDMKAATAAAAGGQVDRQAMGEKRTQATKDIEAVLTDDQKAKLPEVLKTLGVYNTVGIPVGALPDLKLTADQKTKIAEIGKEATEKMTAARQAAQGGGDPQAGRDAMMAARKDATDKVTALLTDTQKTALKA